MTTLTDRYVHAVVRLLPSAQRDDIGRELREMIGDLTAARLERVGATDRAEDPEGAVGPADPEATAERVVLTELGDPNLLATRYVERPRSLIGQEYFPEYVRMLKIVLAIAVPVVVALAVVGALIGDDPGVGGVFGAAVHGAYQAALQTAFWVTLVYAFAHRWKDRGAWTPDDLPDVATATGDPARRGEVGVGDLVFGIVATALTGVLLVWQEVSPFVRHDGSDVPLLHPDLWNGGGQALIAMLVLSLLLQVVVLARRRWTYTLATVNLAVDAAFVAIVAWLALDERLVNPRLLAVLADRADWSTVPTVNPWAVIAVVAATAAWEAFDAFRHARRS